ncbi:MAG: glycosyltransferase family 4 protein [Burkholderiales bacterium]
MTPTTGMTSSNQRIAFIKTGGFSHINDRVFAMLRTRFPGAEIDVVDTNELPVWGRFGLPAMAINVLLQYGIKRCRNTSSIKRYGQRTTGFFDTVRSQLRARLGRGNYLFTIQTQSMIDASQPGTPHFIYTDHTHLTNLYYVGFDRTDLYATEWLAKEREIYENASTVFTMSSHVSRSLCEQYGIDESRIERIRVGSNIDIPPAETLPPERYAGKRILFVGIDWERKGGPQLIEAFKQVLQRHPDALLTIIGCSPVVDVANCKVLGRLPLKEVSQHYLDSAVFCLPTRNEPFGIVFLEAFAHRMPIVSSDIGALPDIVQNGVSGYMVPPDDIDALAEKLIELIASPDKCKEFGQAGFDHFRTNFTWENTGRLLEDRIRQEIDHDQQGARQH